MSNQKVILAYSGGLDTTCQLFWLKEQGYQVICYLADIGQDEDFEKIKKQALSLGAIDAVVENRQREFIEEFIYPALSFGTIYQERYLLGTSLARPCITKGIVELAKKENVNIIAHGATGKGNDQVRFELTAACIAPHIKVIAPWRLPEFYERFKGRKDLLEYAAQNGFKTPATAAKPYSIDSNLMHISYESGILENPLNKPNDDMFAWTKSLESKMQEFEQKLTKTSDSKELLSTVNNFLKEVKPTNLEIKLVHGIPVELSFDGKVLKDSVDIIKALNDIGAKHGVGRIDIVEDRFIGMKSRGVYETPGSTILYTAVQDLQTLCLDKEVNKIRQDLANQFAEKIYNGLWFSPEGLFLKSCLKTSQQLVNGVVRLSIFAGRITVDGRLADKSSSLYDEDLVSMDVQGEFLPTDAGGFIRTQKIRLNAFNHLHKTNPYQ